MKTYKSSFPRIVIILLFILSSAATQFLFGQKVKIKIIETSDVHGAILPYDFINDRLVNHSLAQVYTYVQDEREKEDQNVLLFDNGDILQGQPIVYYYNFEKTDVTNIVADAFNYMKYDAATIGNHDIETGHPVYDKVYEELSFPWLAANAVHEKTGEQYFTPYHVFEIEGVKVAVLGMITPHIPHWLPEKIWEGIRFEDMIETAEKWIKIIENKENPDVLVGLFHAGVDYTYNNQSADKPLNENASVLVAEQVPGFDVVFVGHDHAIWNFKVENSAGDSVLILGPAAGARTVGVANIEMEFDKENEKWNKTVTGETVDISKYGADLAFVKYFDDAFLEVKEYVSKPIGMFTESITTRESMFGDSPFMGLIHQIQLELTVADVSFAAPLSFNSTINKDTVYVRDMFNLYKYENLLYTMELTGKEIHDYLEYSYSLWFNEMKSQSDHLLNFEFDDEGELIVSERSGAPRLKHRYYNFDSAVGIDYVVDVSKPLGERVKIISIHNGTEFNLEKKYKVAVNSYRGNGGGNHLTEGAKIPKDELAMRVITSTEKDLRYYMMKWIEKQKTITPAALGNWKVIPREWWEKGKEKDYKLLYN
ncbi:bifunctional metallophosphatase/5'-nucleotidase [Bacteroidota bacterium]